MFISIFKTILKFKTQLSLWFIVAPNEAGATFDNSFFNNSFVFLRQLKNGSFLGPVFVHVTGQSQN